MKKLILILIISHCSIIIAEAQWSLQQVNSNVQLRDVKFINNFTGWACGENIIFKTTNSGKNWTEQINPAQSILFRIQPVNDSVVYAAGYCTILKTINGGTNWIGLRSGSSPCSGQNFRALWFNDENTGWVCGSQVTMRTTNGGYTFIDSMGIAGSLFDVHFKDNNTGIMSTFSNRIFRTTNSGVDWYLVPLSSSSSTSECYRFSFVGDTGWIATLGDNIVYKTTNYGMSWDSISVIPNGNNEHTYSIDFASSLTGYSGSGIGKIFKSTNGGLIWSLEPTEGFGFAVYNIFALTDSIVWAAGNLGKILYTTTGGGLIVNANELKILALNYALHQNYPNPFNPVTTIRFELQNTEYVSVQVYDVLGNKVATAVKGKKNIGIHEVEFDGSNLPSGIYFYSLSINGNTVHTKRMVLVK